MGTAAGSAAADVLEQVGNNLHAQKQRGQDMKLGQAISNINGKEVLGSAVGGGMAKAIVKTRSAFVSAAESLVATATKVTTTKFGVRIAKSDSLPAIVEPMAENVFEYKFTTPTVGGGGKQTMSVMATPDSSTGGLYSACVSVVCVNPQSSYAWGGVGSWSIWYEAVTVTMRFGHLCFVVGLCC